MNIDPILDLDLRPTLKHVMTVLTFRAYAADNEAHMDYERLMRETSLSRRALKSAVADLEDMGLIEVRRTWGRGNYNIYTINMQKVQDMHPLNTSKGAAAAPLAEKNLDSEKGAKNDTKGAPNAEKGASNSIKGAADAPNKTKKIKNKTARIHARGKMPPRTGPTGPAAKERRKKEPAVNRANGAGGSPGGRNQSSRPHFHETTNTEARETWSNCLQGKTPITCIPDSALLGPIEQGEAYIFNLSGFQRDQIVQNYQRFTMEDRLSKLTGKKTSLVLIKKEKAA